MKNQGYIFLAVLVVFVLLAFLLLSYNRSAGSYNNERFQDDGAKYRSVADIANASGSVRAADGMGDLAPADGRGNETYNPVAANTNASPAACFPRDRLTAEDLLPKDAANTRWAQMNPAGQGDVRDQNFLNAAYHVGIDTQGSSLRNANWQLRSEPINPMSVVGPWNQSTIEPDTMRRALEVGGD